MIVVDTSLVYALLDGRDALYPAALTWYETVDEELATTPLVVAELDYLARVRAGAAAQRAFRRDLADGAYAVDWWRSAAQEAVGIAERYDDLGLSLADASLVALADRLSTTSIATFDERHFRAIEPLGAAAAFRLLPADAS